MSKQVFVGLYSVNTGNDELSKMAGVRISLTVSKDLVVTVETSDQVHMLTKNFN